MQEEIKNWLDSAQYDLVTAEAMYSSGRYIYAVFMCHLALEKILKAKVEQVTGEIPPRIHNLPYLLHLSGLSLADKEAVEFLSELSNLSVVTRYPEDFQRTLEAFSEERAGEFLKHTKRVFEWIRNSLV